jgi:hypothetical protein
MRRGNQIFGKGSHFKKAKFSMDGLVNDGISSFNCAGGGREVSHHSRKKNIPLGQNLRTGLPHASF